MLSCCATCEAPCFTDTPQKGHPGAGGGRGCWSKNSLGDHIVSQNDRTYPSGMKTPQRSGKSIREKKSISVGNSPHYGVVHLAPRNRDSWLYEQSHPHGTLCLNASTTVEPLPEAVPHSILGGGPVERGVWTAKTVKRPPQQPAHPQYANYWAPLTRKRHIPRHSAQPQHTKCWGSQTRKRHKQEHRPQRPSERGDPTQHAKGRTGDRPGPHKGTTTRRNVTQGVNSSVRTRIRTLFCKMEYGSRTTGGGFCRLSRKPLSWRPHPIKVLIHTALQGWGSSDAGCGRACVCHPPRCIPLWWVHSAPQPPPTCSPSRLDSHGLHYVSLQPPLVYPPVFCCALHVLEAWFLFFLFCFFLFS